MTTTSSGQLCQIKVVKSCEYGRYLQQIKSIKITDFLKYLRFFVLRKTCDIHVSKLRFIQYIVIIDRCQIVMILTAVILSFGYPQKLAVYRINLNSNLLLIRHSI